MRAGAAQGEVGAAEIDRALSPDVRGAHVAACRRRGYAFVCLDLEGYRVGSLNEVLTP